MKLSAVSSSVLLADRDHYARLVNAHRGCGNVLEANRLATLAQIEDELARRGFGQSQSYRNTACPDCNALWTLDHDPRPCAACDVERCSECGDANECACQEMESATSDAGLFPPRSPLVADSIF